MKMGTLWIASCLLIPLLLSCGVRSPRDQRLGATGVPNHTGITSQCTDCHEDTRPSTTTLPEASTPTSSGHFGSLDCSNCHLPPAPTDTGPAAFLFNHFANGPGQTECAPCHEARRPPLLVGSMLHSESVAQGDCVKCHVGGAGTSWSNGTFQHVNVTLCAACHGTQAPTYMVKPGHGSFYHIGAANMDCSRCHRDPGGSFLGGEYGPHSPAQCEPCHQM